jgi:hypothetical protein
MVVIVVKTGRGGRPYGRDVTVGGYVYGHAMAMRFLPKGWVEARNGRVRWIAGQCPNVMSKGVVEYGGENGYFSQITMSVN